MTCKAPPPSSQDKETRNGKCTRPKAPLEDINLPPWQRQIGSSPTTFRAFRNNQNEDWKEEDKVKKSSGRVTGPKAFLKDINLPPLHDKKIVALP